MKQHLLRTAIAAAFAASLAAQIPDCEDMKTTESGLQYGVIEPGRDEPGPAPENLVKVHYTGWLTDGTKFDSSRDRGEPAQFGLRDVIPGWTEGLQLMTPGARFKFVIPPALGYGEMQQGDIPPNSTLVFDVELLEVIRLPEMPESTGAAKDLPSGISYEVVRVGTGAQAGKTQAVAMRFAIFAKDGQLQTCSELRNGQLLGGTRESLPFPFLRELVDVVKRGDVIRLDIPAGKAQGMRGDTVWLLEVVGVHEVPEYRSLAPEQTVTTDSGLKYEVIAAGEGDAPGPQSRVEALYTGWLTDGTMFDSAHARGAPSEFALNGVIPGWTEGLQLMRPGGKFLFEIPPELGYGVRGSPPKIGPNATLVFLVELVGVK